MRMDYQLAPPIGEKATLGVIVLQADETLEHDFRRLLPTDGVALYMSRIASPPEIRPDTLQRMRDDLTSSAALFPKGLHFDAVAYGCTSATSVIGAHEVAAQISAGCKTNSVTEPVSALHAACAKLGIKRLALLTPYVPQVSDQLRAVLQEMGLEFGPIGSFNEASDARVARIDPKSIAAAAKKLVASSSVDGIFISCTNLRTLDIIAEIEAETGTPVLSSNLVLGWHLAKLAGIDLNPGFGRLSE